MNDTAAHELVWRMPVALRPWWSQRLAAPPPLATKTTARVTRRSSATSYLEATYEPGSTGHRESIPAAPPPSSQSEEDLAGEELASAASASVPGRLALAVSGWPLGRGSGLGHLSLERRPARRVSGSLTAAAPPRLSGREHLGDDEAVQYSIDLVR